ncbi:hypothetical protein Ahy_B08g090141 [Arachis hypogaea]|uniref:Uncharacterized protein n=1 Tax=Arachis hypogaea TaxID=3818 RepID=A0A444XZK6_ARAHY|nr:hypothetical protein Ahy_B08g090141 [Arachis hypogaea]
MITCNRESKRKSRVSPIEKTNPRTNYNCPARISIRLNKEGLWVISKVSLDHSQPCNPEMAKLLTHNREISMHMCRVIERNDEAGVRPSKTYQVLADTRSRATYEYFGDVVSFDTTYKTNRYDMPFGSFVGLNLCVQNLIKIASQQPLQAPTPPAVSSSSSRRTRCGSDDLPARRVLARSLAGRLLHRSSLLCRCFLSVTAASPSPEFASPCSNSVYGCFVGIPNFMPYSSQPLFTATQSSPETI